VRTVRGWGGSRRNREQKRKFYADIGVAEYWIIDRDQQRITVVRPGRADADETESVIWFPDGASESLVVDVPWVLFGRTHTT
jgi:Uma2 family endonuclease